MSSALNYLIFLLYVVCHFYMVFYDIICKKCKDLSTFSLVFLAFALIFHVYSLQPIFDSNYSIDLSINHALMIVAFIISISLYILSIIGNTQYLGIIILPIISIIFLFNFSNNPVNVSLNNIVFIHVIISLILQHIMFICLLNL